tara:strand:+ start:485 stop:733 length:249 start_codon:yes stop_codon:yes gene_type:complete
MWSFFFIFTQIKIMKIIILQSLLRDGKRYKEGDTIDLPNNIAKNWIKKGLGDKIRKKKNKTPFETKELKVEFTENKKDEARS